MKLSIVMPVYNEKNTLETILERVHLHAAKLQGIDSYEVLLINDASTDGTDEVLDSIEKEQSQHCRVFHQEKNQGKGAAITRGFQESHGDVVLIQDADMEYDPEDYQKLIDPILKGRADSVFGSRFKGEVARVLYFWHYKGNQFLTFLSNAFTNLNMTDMETCYKVFRGPIIRNMKLKSQRFGIEPEMTAKLSKLRGVRIYEVPVSYYGRTYEEGKKIGWKDGVSAIWCILKFNLMNSLADSFQPDFLRAWKDKAPLPSKPMDQQEVSSDPPARTILQK